MQKKLKIIIGIFSLIFLVTLISMFRLPNLVAQDGKSTLKFNSKKDKLYYPKKQDISRDLILAGKIDAETKSDVQFQTSGRLTWVGVKTGDMVKKGQALASLDKTELKKQLQKQFNDYSSTLSNFDDVDYTYKEKKMRLLITEDLQRIINRSQFSLNNAVINYELADLAIKYATITSPISGIVTNVEQSVPGVNITPSSATFSIIDPETIYLKSEIDEEDVPNVKIGQPTKIKIDSLPDKSFDSSVKYISFTPVTGQSSTVYEIRFILDAPNSNLTYRLGMNGDATVNIQSAKNVIILPIDLVHDDGAKFVYLKDKNSDKVTRKNIKTGIENDTDIEILEGLTENDQVVDIKTK